MKLLREFVDESLEGDWSRLADIDPSGCYDPNKPIAGSCPGFFLDISYNRELHSAAQCRGGRQDAQHVSCGNLEGLVRRISVGYQDVSGRKGHELRKSAVA